MSQFVSQFRDSIATTLDVLVVQYPLLGFLVAVVGSWKLFSLAWTFGTVVNETLIPAAPRVKAYKPQAKTEANWAVVTGCTAGIGEQFAHQLAAAGFNIALVSRNPEKLASVGKDINAKYSNIKTAAFALDAATAGNAEYGAFKTFVEELGNVSILINNAGISYDMPTPFTELPVETVREIIQVNCVATLEVTKAVLPTIQAYTAKNRSQRGLVLTMGSMAGLTPTPLLAVYSGSKMFLQGWSSALAEEVKTSNIDVELVISYLVISKMSKMKRSTVLAPTPKDFVKSTLRQIGRRGGAQERANTSTPYWSHALFHWAIENTVGVWSTIVASINLSMHQDIRKRALRKKAKQQ